MGHPLAEPQPRVECRSEHRYAQQPLAVWWQGQRLAVETVETAWRSPCGPAFRVRCAAGQAFTLVYDEARDDWEVTPFS